MPPVCMNTTRSPNRRGRFASSNALPV
jgi:hypothetical protein